MSVILGKVDVIDSRTSEQDSDGVCVGISEDGTVVARSTAYLSELSVDQYKIGAGTPKTGRTGVSEAIYIDIVIMARDESWMLIQPTSAYVVIDGVSRDILNRPREKGKKAIGHDLARVGLPKFAFGPIFNNL
ncbi:hypothetical protein GP486_005638 [Trichoglossum hirsutum]|uniref:Uncharacterized protein n=1 Tax=Trichoglossum hirsutum TaxID=265104 RepID=A0A9P8RM94_9PEZI|nr:hypothetical protein GP486_005638 [Trichoglossum hirsutum]